MEYLQLNGIPVPRVYAWSSTTSNVVGAEYIIMEKMDGTPLGDIWFTLDFKQRRNNVEQVVQLERKLFILQFPANGSIYFPRDLNEHERAQSFPLQVQGHEFCIGPMAHYSWWHGTRSSLDCDRGPCTYIHIAYLVCLLHLTSTDVKGMNPTIFFVLLGNENYNGQKSLRSRAYPMNAFIVNCMASRKYPHGHTLTL